MAQRAQVSVLDEGCAVGLVVLRDGEGGGERVCGRIMNLVLDVWHLKCWWGIPVNLSRDWLGDL